MIHGLNNDFLYAAFRIQVTFQNEYGDKKDVSGTAFFARNKRRESCLVTNRHLVDLGYKSKDSKYIRYRLIDTVLSGKKVDSKTGLPTLDQVFQVDFSQALFSDKYENDIACLINPKFTYDTSSEVPVIDYHVPYHYIATKERLAEELLVCDFVAFPGYPSWFDKLNSRPILRSGNISSDPRFDYSYSGTYDGECVAYEAFSFGGSSGSPIFAIAKGFNPNGDIILPGSRDIMMIGINAGHLPGEHNSHSGISYLYKSSAILDIIDN